MIQDTVQRLDGVADLAPPLVICNESHRFLVAEQLREIDDLYTQDTMDNTELLRRLELAKNNPDDLHEIKKCFGLKFCMLKKEAAEHCDPQTGDYLYMNIDDLIEYNFPEESENAW